MEKTWRASRTCGLIGARRKPSVGPRPKTGLASPRGLHCAPFHRLSRRLRARHSPRREGTRRIGIPDEGAGSAAGLRPLVRTPAHATPRLVKPALGGKLEIRDGGLKVTSGKSRVSLRFGSNARLLARSPARRPAAAAVRQRDDRARHEPRRAVADGRRSVRAPARGAGASTPAKLLRGSQPTARCVSRTARRTAGLRILPVVIFDKERGTSLRTGFAGRCGTSGNAAGCSCG